MRIAAAPTDVLIAPMTIANDVRSRTADEDAGDKDQHAADDDLEGGLQERRVHVAGADPGDRGKFDRDDGERERGRQRRNAE